MICLTQKLMAKLFAVTVSAINQHLKSVFDGGEPGGGGSY
jgi:hypothetical protein